MNTHLTTDNFPHVLLGKTLTDKDFEYVDDVELIKGKSIIVNKVGTMWLYMSDDHRREVPKQIIVKQLGNYEMAFLDIESKRAIKLINCKSF